MKTENDSIENLFKNLEGQWDIHEPSRGHSDRFLDKQARRKAKPAYSITLAIAASVVLAFGLFTFYDKGDRPQQLAAMSQQTREADSVFTAIIKYEVSRMKEKDSKENRQIVNDALAQLKEMDADYEKIRAELAKGGETQQLIHALISNLKTQIAFLENVLRQIEQNEQLNTTTDENVM